MKAFYSVFILIIIGCRFFFFIILLLVLELFGLLSSKGKQNRQAALHTSQISSFLAALANATHNRNLVRAPNAKMIRAEKGLVNVVAECNNKHNVMHNA